MADETKDTAKAHCPKCDGERTCDVHGTTTTKWAWDDKYNGEAMSGGADHSLLQCRGCETVFYESKSWNSEEYTPYYDHMGEVQYEADLDIVTFPRPEAKTKPAWFDAMRKVDAQLHRILSQVYTASDNQAHILTAVGLRTALDRGMEVLGIDPAKSFEEKLNDLQKSGWIGQSERDVLGVVTDAGNAAAHRGWEPDGHEISDLISAMEVFLHRAFIVGNKALAIKSNIPAKPKRLPAPKTPAS
jgi:hypothetical protein